MVHLQDHILLMTVDVAGDLIIGMARVVALPILIPTAMMGDKLGATAMDLMAHHTKTVAKEELMDKEVEDTKKGINIRILSIDMCMYKMLLFSII